MWCCTSDVCVGVCVCVCVCVGVGVGVEREVEKRGKYIDVIEKC